MTTVNRPNRDALNRAVDIFRDAMRPFIVRCLKSVPRRSVDQLISAVLPDNSAEQFRANFRSLCVRDRIVTANIHGYCAHA